MLQVRFHALLQCTDLWTNKVMPSSQPLLCLCIVTGYVEGQHVHVHL